MQQTSAPEVQTSAPEVQTSAVEVQTSAPEVQTSAPEVRPTAPEVRTSAPEVQTSALVPRTFGAELCFIRAVVCLIGAEVYSIAFEARFTIFNLCIYIVKVLIRCSIPLWRIPALILIARAGDLRGLNNFKKSVLCFVFINIIAFLIFAIAIMLPQKCMLWINVAILQKIIQ